MVNSIYLKPMTKALARRYHQNFVMDPDLFLDPSQFRPFVYSEEYSDRKVERYAQLGRVFMAVMLGDEPIGELVLKNVDTEKQCATLGISMVNDFYKNRGYGTRAEQLALDYAFDQMQLTTVYADALVTNLRSQHVLQKVGFRKIGADSSFVYYRCDREQ